LRALLAAGRELRLRAGRLAGLLLLAALLSLPLPLWHFIGVPGFLAAAVWMGARRLRQERAIEQVAGPCPACGQPQQFEVPPEAQFPLTVACPGCRAFLKLRTA
jgi:hypothetical protein